MFSERQHLQAAAQNVDEEFSLKACATLIKTHEYTPAELGEALLSAITEQGNYQVALLLAKGGANLDLTDDDGFSFLHHAAQYDVRSIANGEECAQSRLTFITKLLAQGVSVDPRTLKEQTPLHIAAGTGFLAAAKLLEAQGAEVNVSDIQGMRPLHVAATQGHANFARWLVSKKAVIGSKAATGVWAGCTPAMIAQRKQQQMDVQHVLAWSSKLEQKKGVVSTQARAEQSQARAEDYQAIVSLCTKKTAPEKETFSDALAVWPRLTPAQGRKKLRRNSPQNNSEFFSEPKNERRLASSRGGKVTRAALLKRTI